MRKLFLVLAALILGAGIASRPAQAQIGSTTDIVTGRVLGPDGKPIENVTVAVKSAESGITRTKRTDASGRYTILFPDGGGQYRVEFRAIGFAPVSRNVARQGDEDRLVTDIQLGSQVAAKLSTVTVTARNSGRARGVPPTPGESGRTISAEQLARLPVDMSDIAAIAAMAPGVVGIAGNDTTAAAFSVAGQRSTLNNTTLDGLSFGSFSVPTEGLRSTRVITNTFDPAKGQFSGGEIASTTRGGTNELTGGFTYSRRDPVLEFEGADSAAVSPTYLQDQISAGFGGPIIKDKMFIFGSGQLRRRSDPVQSLLASSPATLSTLGLDPASVQAFESKVNALGIPSPAAVPDRRIGDNTVGLVRLDYFLNDANSLTLRGDYRGSTQDPTRSNPYALPSSAGASTTSGAGLAATLTSNFESGLINELRTYYSRDNNHSEGYLTLPAGRVRISSPLADGTQALSVISFGGNPGFPQAGSSSLLEAGDEVSYLSKDRTHRLRLGSLFDLNTFRQNVTSNRLGTFTYNSLGSFLAGAPDSYSRTLLSQERAGKTVAGALYLGDTWRPNRQVQLVYGLRAEGTRIDDAPALNSDIETKFGLRTSDFPSEVHVSPRVGFSINLTQSNPNDPFSQFQPAFLLRGGVGEFRAKTPTGLFTSAAGATGLTDTEQQVSCIGPAVPTPDWQSYLADAASAPTACVSAVTVPPNFSAVRPAVTLFSPDFEAPRSLRASLGIQHRLFGNVTLSADGSYARGVALYGVKDLNLNTTPAFLLADEGNRPVFAPSAAIVPTTGQVTSSGSRIYPQYGQVLELTSGLKSDTKQFTMSVNGATQGGTIFTFAYTLQRTRDQSSFTCCSAAQGFASPTTGGNPNLTEWAPGDQDVRHTLQTYFTKPVKSWLEVTANARLSSGAPFTPIVSGDINGDGSHNDRAFIFNPATTADAALAAAMKQLIAGSPSNVRDCLASQLGTVAGRNSCRGPWTPSLDMQANFRPEGFNLSRKMTFSFIGSNVLAGLDQLIHGSNLRGWGQFNRADPTLLYVRGFDPVKQEFVYDVNGRFGSTNTARAVYRQPFVLALQARLMLGPDPRDRFRQIFAARTDSSTIAAAAVQNPVAQIIQLRDTLNLNDAQVAQLTVVADTLAAKSLALGVLIRAQVAKQGSGGNPVAIMSAIRPQIIEGRQNLTSAMAKVQTILTPDQWKKVPEHIKNPPAFGGRGGGGRGPGM
ncbi:MAG: carboxypeptidase regulatory-like domain-containing protein [Gemmatimonadaceae bacterium]